MKTSLPFYHKLTNVKSNCGDPLEISLSSKDLGWEGVLVERGTSPHFHPKDVITPNFYFAVEMENSFQWSITQAGEEISMETDPGDIWMNPPNTPFTHNIDVPCNFLIINISEELMYNSFGSPLPNGLLFLNNYNIQDRTLKNLMELLCIELQNKGVNGKWYINQVVQLFSGYFIRQYSNYEDLIKNQESTSIIGPDEINLIDNYIEKHIALGITIEELADELSISKFHFLNEFKKANGITPYQHILNKRVDKAKELLQDKSLKITSIALDLGFSDSSHFSRTFKKASGFSPKAYRDSL